MNAIPAISLWQPWASFIAIGVKPYETRHWRADRFIGRRIVIHAAKHRIREGEVLWWRKIAGDGAALPLGAMVCTALLRDIIPAHLVPEDEFGNYAPGRWAWHLTEIERLEPPVPARGAQGFWMWTP